MDCQYNLHSSKVSSWLLSNVACCSVRQHSIALRCRPMRASSSDPLASPVSPGNWMLSMPSASSSTPFSPAQATYGLHTRAPQHQLPSKYTLQLKFSKQTDLDKPALQTALLLDPCQHSISGMRWQNRAGITDQALQHHNVMQIHKHRCICV